MTFEEWWKETGQNLFTNLGKRSAQVCWQAATLAERERAAKMVSDWECCCNNDCCLCGCTETQEQIAAAIRKGEGV